MESAERDGMRLAFRSAGAGRPSIVFIHPSAADRTFFASQLEHCAGRHGVVAVGLRGHVESDKPQQEHTMVLPADEVAWLSKQLGPENLVLVGHSMGSVIALELSRPAPICRRAVVSLNSSTLSPIFCSTPSPCSWRVAQPGPSRRVSNT
jgi:pimeloyl-ACP methyl ester carboxylesterase